MIHNFFLCTNVLEVMPDRRNEGFANMVSRELCHLKKDDMEPFSRKGRGGGTACRTTADDEDLGMLGRHVTLLSTRWE